MGILGFGKKKPAPSQVPEPVPAGPATSPSSKAKNIFVIVIFDSCRYDTFMEAAPETIQKLGKEEERYSYASWTAPSHYNLLMGLVPHVSPSRVYASEYYKNDFLRYNERLGSEGIVLREARPRTLPADLSPEGAGLPDTCQGLSSRPEPEDAHQPGVRHLPAHEKAQRGWVDECEIHLGKGEEEVFTIFIHPLGGKTEVTAGYVERKPS